MSILKEYGLKETRQRLEIVNLFNNYNDLTIKDIKELVNMDNSTIYRIIDLFVKNSILIMDVDENRGIRYALKSRHKHHLHCVKCQSIIEIDSCPLEKSKELNGFLVLDHHLDIEGICKACQKVL